MCSILEALVVSFNIVKHQLHVCLELVAGQRGGGELCRAGLVRDLSELVNWSWNNGKEVPRWGVAEIQKMSPSTTGHIIVVTNSPPIGHMKS